MEQVFKNLYSNAVKYSPGGGLIKTTVIDMEDRIWISIEDHGIGMTPDQVARVFEKFYRADASNTAIQGTGLGMTIVQNLLEAHGGKVWVESIYGAGTTVKLEIPLTRPDNGRQEQENKP
jgi:signal transduction histidine kinase